MPIDWKVSDRSDPWREVRGILRELAAIELGLLPDEGNLKVTPRRFRAERNAARTLSAHRCHSDIRTLGRGLN